MAQRSKILPIILPPATYKRLEREARAADRDAVQHARWLLRQVLETDECGRADIDDLEPAEAAR